VRRAHEIVLECGDLSPLSFFNIGFKSADESAHSKMIKSADKSAHSKMI